MSSSKLAVLSLSMFACVVGATSIPNIVTPASANINWEDFDASIDDEDCFGSHCGKSSAALSMLQRSFASTKLDSHQLEERKAAMTNEAKRWNGEESTMMEGMPAMEDLADALESEEDADDTALNLVQTGASVERTSIEKPMAMAANADGSFELNPQMAATPEAGSMVFSIDDHGGLHKEEGMSLVQTEAHIKHNVATAEAPSALKIRKTETPSDAEVELEDKETAALSLMQTDTLLGHKRASSAVQADGELEMNPKKIDASSNGMMQFSIDGNGNFHSEDEGFSLLQTDARIEEPASEPIAQKQAEVLDHPHWSVEAESPMVEGLSLIQSHAHVQRSASIQADGNLEMQPTKAPASDGMMTLSVNGHGDFHYEI